jgi:LPXTG-motif cell wall-anchored protein
MPPRWLTRSVAAAAGATAPAAAQSDPLSVDVFLPDIVVPAGGAGAASITVDADRDATVDDLVFTFDLGDIAGLATINIDSGSFPCSTSGSVMTCANDFPEDLFEDGISFFEVEVIAEPGATVGATGTLGVTVNADGATASHDASVTIAEAVDLIASDRLELTTEPGDTLTVPLTVENAGPAAAEGVAMEVFGEFTLRPATRHSNCSYSAQFPSWLCMFDVVLEPGTTYEFDTPFQLAVGADTVAPSVGLVEVVWRTRAEAAAVLSERSARGIEQGTPGTGPALSLVESGGGAPDPLPADPVPGADRDPENNWTPMDINVEGENGADLAAVGASVPGDVGDTVTVRVGVENLGPATLDASRAAEPVNWVRVTLPGGTSAAELPDACQQNDDEGEYLCSTGSLLPAGDSELFEFVLRIDQASATNGLVAVNQSPDPAGGEPFDDGNQSNDTAEIVVGAGGGGGGLPVTGASGRWAAAAGVLLVAVGAGCLLAVRRRRTRFVA